MAEYKVRIWRRIAPLLGNSMKIKRLERDEVAVEAADEDAALRQVARAEYAEADFLDRLMESVKQQDTWATACLSVFTEKLLPQIEEIVATATESGQDASTAVSVSMGMSMEAAKSFVICLGLVKHGLTGNQITEIIVCVLRGEDATEVAARFGITDEMVGGL